MTNKSVAVGHPSQSSPNLSRILSSFIITSPQVKRKAANPLENNFISKHSKHELNSEKTLHDQLILIYKSKKNKEQMPALVEQTFSFRRSFIENSNKTFIELNEDFH